MDDPWGSPWGDETETKRSIELQASHGPTLEADFHTPVKAATLALEQSNTSPWNDGTVDDEFGDWSSMPVEGGQAGGHTAKDDHWDGDAANTEVMTGHSRSQSPGWQNEVSEPHAARLAPSLMPKSSIRQPSPDPWALEITSNEEEKRGGKKPHGSILGLSNNHLKIASEDLENKEIYAAHDAPNTAEAFHALELEDVDTGRENDARSPSLQKQEREIVGTDPQSSRPSSSPSEGSHHGALHESPRTSMDDEPKRPHMSTKVSSKVQGLVGHFDGLVYDKALGVGGHGETIVGTKDINVGADADDFGDFEEGHSDVEGEAEDALATVVQSPVNEKVPSTPKAVNMQPDLSSPTITSKSFYGPVDIDVDLSILEKLFSGIKSDSVSEEVFIPDTIPYDCFTSTEQRKTWYRISRYGTMRKHNSGNDENYVRVSWPRSQMKDDTLKIVARWMEEDRASGRVVLGGASKTSSIFGWNDSRASAVPLSTAFAPQPNKKTSQRSPSSVSESPRSPATPSSPVFKSPVSRSLHKATKSISTTNKIKEVPPSPVTSFGWSSIPESRPRSSIESGVPSRLSSEASEPLPVRTLTSSLRPRPVPKTHEAIDSPQSIPVSTIDCKSPAQSNFGSNGSFNAVTTTETNDDDWGNMVSSPNMPSLGEHPPFRNIQHAKSQSLVSSPLSGGSVLSHASYLPKAGLDEPASSKGPGIMQTSSKPAYTASNHSYLGTRMPMQQPASAPSPSRVPVPNDPWASADFSFFDVPIMPEQKTDAKAIPAMPPGIPPVRPATVENSSAAPRQQPEHRSKNEIEQDSILQNIIKGLPDLSYMLRR